jgi:hypothetical protein
MSMFKILLENRTFVRKILLKSYITGKLFKCFFKLLLLMFEKKKKKKKKKTCNIFYFIYSNLNGSEKL